jgi:hypothetical protein
MFLGGFVETYPDQKAAQEAMALLGFEDTAKFHSYVTEILGEVPVPEALLRKGAAALLSDPGKLKNYPFPVTEDALVNMAN